MGWFRKRDPEQDYWPRPVVAYERVIPRDYTALQTPVPESTLDADEELAITAERSTEWTRMDRKPIPVIPPLVTPPSLTLPWTRETPTVEGVYWHVPAIDVGVLHVLVVVRYGSHLCVRTRRANSDSVVYLGINRIGGWFCGPIQTPEGTRLEEIDVS